MTVTTPEPTERGGEHLPWTQRLYLGNGYFDIVGKRKRWYIGFALLVLVCIASLGLKGFNLGIDFEGGTKIQMPATGVQGPIEVDQVQDAFQDALGRPAETVQVVGSGGGETIQIRTESLNAEQVGQVKESLFGELQPIGPNGAPSAEAISDSAVSGTWGGEITQQALIALGVFIVLVTIFLGFYFERWMAVAALVALLHDVVVTAGIYSLIGFEVTPSTVIGLLTILGFSLYDTVVVFDKVRENTRGLLGLTRRTYPEAANLAVNQTLMRSINTSIIALLPVAGLLFVGAGLLGVGMLRDLALVQLIGMIAGVVSSILLATPLLVDFKMRDAKYREHRAKVLQRRERGTGGESDASGDDSSGSSSAPSAAGSSATGGSEVAMASSGRSARDAGPKRGNRPSAKSRPSGKSGRPSGKKRR
ncbi:protein translocase subunit SecF [Saccharopolyspora sp. HNM0983]|uniref:Protein-export membrane protein SecF n=1 Tax=Saccharopolyspora montiporae TaxID=2781240 RepID=A0A929B6Z6_9PSEU|nr:protein translocase subunit SecF [Saccharopolyspora sp. HNM0983]